MKADTAEMELLEQLAAELEAQGYEVFVRPERSLLPSFLGNFRPDAIARRNGTNLVIEVMRRSPDSTKALTEITELLKGRHDWKLRLLWIEPTNEQEPLAGQDPDAMAARIAEVRALAQSGHGEPALLLAWATFEALARALMAEQLGSPQSPRGLVQVLAADGLLTPTEADRVRELAIKRNKLAHGELQHRATRDELSGFAGLLDTLLRQVREAIPPSAIAQP